MAKSGAVSAAVAAAIVGCVAFGGAQQAGAAEFPTAPKQLTTPEENTSDGFHKIIGTQNGGFILAWKRGNRVTFQSVVLAQRFSAAGKPVGKPATIDGPGFIEGLPELVALDGDKYGILWKTLGDSGPSLRAVTMDGATGKLGRPVVVLPSGAASFIHDMARLENGKIAVVTRSFATGGEDTILLLLDDKLKPIGSPKLVEDDVAGPFGAASYEQTVVANGAGGVAIFRASDSQLKGVKFDAAGRPGATFQINTTPMPALDLFGLARFTVDAKPLDNGGYVVTWVAYDPGQQLRFNVFARVFDGRGRPVGNDFIVHQDVSGNQYNPDILVAPKGFGVGWTDEATLGQTTQVVRFFDLKGAPLSDDVVTEYFGADGRGVLFPSVDAPSARLKDGSFVKTFASGGLYGDGIAAPLVGKPKNDTLSAGPEASLVLGAGGRDTLAATTGADTIDGGDGDDAIDAGSGENQIVPGGGDDQITASGGKNVFAFRPGGGSDVIEGFKATDRIDVSAFHYNQKDNVLADAVQVGKDTVITLKDQTNPSAPPNVVRLKRFKRVNLTAASIIL